MTGEFEWMSYLNGRWVALLMCAAICSGCDALINTVMIDPPNKGVAISTLAVWDVPTRKSLGLDQTFRVPVFHPRASIFVGVLEPKVKPKGTILILHGFRNAIGWVMVQARHFADAGYRTVLVDLRGHGGSTGQFITYGVVEASDLSQVLDVLEKHKRLAGRVGVWGASMGASTAIQLAARDRRVETVVAVMPYASLRKVVPDLVRLGLPVVGWLMTDQHIQSVVDRSATEAGFDPDDADTLVAIEKTKVPIFILHGTWDQIVSVEHSRELHEIDPERIKLELLPGHGHLSLGLDPDGTVRRRSVGWFDRHLIPKTENP
jgi:pimeloyl-ACP methyl ester carboxylesterase